VGFRPAAFCILQNAPEGSAVNSDLVFNIGCEPLTSDRQDAGRGKA